MPLSQSFDASENKDAKGILVTDMTSWTGGYLTDQVTSSVLYVTLPNTTVEISVTANTLPNATFTITPYLLGLTTDPSDTETQLPEGNTTIRWALSVNPGSGVENYNTSAVLLCYKITLGKIHQLIALMAAEEDPKQREILFKRTEQCWLLLQAALYGNGNGMYTESEYNRSLCYDIATQDPYCNC